MYDVSAIKLRKVEFAAATDGIQVPKAPETNRTKFVIHPSRERSMELCPDVSKLLFEKF